MIKTFKRFRKRHLSNDPVIALFPLGACGKVLTHDEGTKHSFAKKDEETAKISNEEALSSAGHEVSSENEFVLTRHLEEPTEIDHPIRCPHPEPCIIQDGSALKERAPSLKRRGQLPFVTMSEVQRLRWNRRSAPNDCQIYPAASAPEHSIVDALP